VIAPDESVQLLPDAEHVLAPTHGPAACAFDTGKGCVQLAPRVIGLFEADRRGHVVSTRAGFEADLGCLCGDRGEHDVRVPCDGVAEGSKAAQGVGVCPDVADRLGVGEPAEPVERARRVLEVGYGFAAQEGCGIEIAQQVRLVGGFRVVWDGVRR
jgi:hypothetical protein